MWIVLQKELKGFFSGVTGFLIIGIFLVSSGLFLWVIPGDYNIPDSGYSSLDGLFLIAPWLFLFLVPALTMRMFSEEKRLGTIELLFTHPLQKYQLVLGKYFASLFLGFFSLLPTLIYFYSVYQMGEHIGNIDVGATWGSYFGLLFIFASFTSIGLFSSALSNNPLISFIVGSTLCFFCYYGLDLASSMFSSGTTQLNITKWSIFSHYQSVSRGVIDSVDLWFFLFIAVVFLSACPLVLLKNSPYSKFKLLKQGLIFLFLFIIISVILNYSRFRIDLTLEKRYTLAKPTKELLKNMKGPIIVDVLLEGDINPSFKKLQEATSDIVEEFNYYQGNINLRLIDPSRMISQKNGKLLSEILEENGTHGVEVNEKTSNGGHLQKVVYPWVSISYNGIERKVNILNNDLGKSGYENINTSIRDLEYNLTNALRILGDTEERAIAFLEGHDEFHEMEVEDISTSISEQYRIDRGVITDNLDVLKQYKLLIIAGSVKPFNEKEKFIIDQYIMQGGKVLWMIDGSGMSLDSLLQKPTTYSFPNDISINDLLFHYGVRINYDLIEDAQCISIPMNTSNDITKPKYEPMPWYFSPLLFPSQEHVIGKNVGPIKSSFASSISLVGKDTNLLKTVLVTTSSASKIHNAPSIVDLRMAAKGVDYIYFNEHNIPVAVLVEGEFKSAFANRMIPEGVNLSGEMLKKSKSTKMVIMSDADLIRNDIKINNGTYEPMPLGYDDYLKQTFSNKSFMLNTINYLCDDEGWMKLRSREISLRLLSKKESIYNRTFWQIINLTIPISLLLISALLFNVIRYKKRLL